MTHVLLRCFKHERTMTKAWVRMSSSTETGRPKDLNAAARARQAGDGLFHTKRQTTDMVTLCTAGGLKTCCLERVELIFMSWGFCGDWWLPPAPHLDRDSGYAVSA
jgi:hypothetical protein